jgi:two-component system, chemotaxis family, chemotaxis protein CheY
MPYSHINKAPHRIERLEDLHDASVIAIEAAASMIGPLSSSLHALKFGSVSVMLSSDAAWQRLTDDPPLRADLILIDWHVHPTPCEEFVRRLRRLDLHQLAETPVICLMANAEKKTVLAARDAGANAVLVRPFSPRQLSEKVLWTLGRDVDFIRSDHYVGPDRRHFNSDHYRGAERRQSAPAEDSRGRSRAPAG